MALTDDHYVVDFEHIDDFRCLRPLGEAVAEDLFEDISPSEKEAQEGKLRGELATLFKEAGWEGDGEINCIFIAPCFTTRGDTACQVVYHVKQGNNGTSWLAIPKKLRLRLPEGFLSHR